MVYIDDLTFVCPANAEGRLPCSRADRCPDKFYGTWSSRWAGWQQHA